MSRELRERGLLLGVNGFMALAHHIMWTVYGRWLPNDLRGSLSRRVRSDALYEMLGPVKARGRAAIRPRAGALREQDGAAMRVLKHPVRLLTGAQAKAAATEVGRALGERWPEVWGPDHPVWTRGGGHSVYLQSRLEVDWAISYVERNPIEAGLPAQRWSFVRPME